MPARTMATISSAVATGRMMNGRDGLMSSASGAADRRSLRAARCSPALRTALLHLLPTRERVRIALVELVQERLAPRELLGVVLGAVEQTLALFGCRQCG